MSDAHHATASSRPPMTTSRLLLTALLVAAVSGAGLTVIAAVRGTLQSLGLFS